MNILFSSYVREITYCLNASDRENDTKFGKTELRLKIMGSGRALKGVQVFDSIKYNGNNGKMSLLGTKNRRVN